MRVVIPIAGDPWMPRPSGVLTYVAGLGRYLSTHGIEVEFLVAGRGRSEGLIQARSIMNSARGETAYAIRLRRFLRKQTYGPGTVALANSELYAWAFQLNQRSIPLVLVVHGPTFPTLHSRRPLAAYLFKLIVEPRAMKSASEIVAIDQDTESYLSRAYPKLRLRSIPTGVDLVDFYPLSRLSCKSKWDVGSRPTLLYVGRFASEKRLDLAIETFRCLLGAIPDSVLLLAGSGPTEDSIRRRAVSLGPDRIRILGPVARADLPSLYSAADGLVLTSAIEQSPTVAIESLACGTPVFSTPVGDIPVLLSHPELGSIISGSPVAMARTIGLRFPENERERTKYETNRRNAAATRSWERIGPQVVEVLDAAVTSG